MSFAFPSSIIPSSGLNRYKIFNLKTTQLFPFANGTQKAPTIFTTKTLSTPKHSSIECTRNNYQPLEEEEDTVDLSLDKEDLEDSDSPWEGAIIYKRSSSTSSHIEYCTTLERLGLGKVSTELSKLRASEMGIRVTNAVKDYPFGTAVQVSIDVTKKKKRFRLDGILKTVIALGCNRCGEPCAESVFSNFSLLLTDEPIEEPDVIDIGTVFGKDKNRTYNAVGVEDGNEDDESLIDFDDRLYFPSGEKEIDISKNIRDLVHLEININAVCDPNCKGMCFKCGTNLNTRACKCSRQNTKKSYGPLGDLKQKMQAKS